MAKLLGGKREGRPLGGDQEVPVFKMKEISEFSPDEMLSEVREFHISRQQWDVLRSIDEGVERDGNPYIGKPLRMTGNAC